MTLKALLSGKDVFALLSTGVGKNQLIAHTLVALQHTHMLQVAAVGSGTSVETILNVKDNIDPIPF